MPDFTFLYAEDPAAKLEIKQESGLAHGAQADHFCLHLQKEEDHPALETFSSQLQEELEQKALMDCIYNNTEHTLKKIGKMRYNLL